MSEDKVLDALVKGREYFATHEWNRNGSYFASLVCGHPNLERCCGIGAVYAAAGFDYEGDFVAATGIDSDDIHVPLYEALTPGQRDAADSFYEFNDFVAESEADVLAVFDRAIEARRAGVAR